MKSGWHKQSRKHRDAYYKGKVSVHQRTVGSAFLHRPEDLKPYADEVLKVASVDQKRVFRGMLAGDEAVFINHLRGDITQESIDKAFNLMVNQVEGDTSQLSPELEAYARRNGMLTGWGEVNLK